MKGAEPAAWSHDTNSIILMKATRSRHKRNKACMVEDIVRYLKMVTGVLTFLWPQTLQIANTFTKKQAWVEGNHTCKWTVCFIQLEVFSAALEKPKTDTNFLLYNGILWMHHPFLFHSSSFQQCCNKHTYEETHKTALNVIYIYSVSTPSQWILPPAGQCEGQKAAGSWPPAPSLNFTSPCLLSMEMKQWKTKQASS